MASSDPPPEEEEEAEDEGSWMTTFSDLMSLLLTFFVLLLSFAQMDIVKFRDAMGSVQDALGFTGGVSGVAKPKPSAVIKMTEEKNDSLIEPVLDMPYKKMRETGIVVLTVNTNEKITKMLEATIAENDLEEFVETELTGRGVVVNVKGQLFFNSGSAILKDDAIPLLEAIIDIVKEFPYNMMVEGHTDNTPISTYQFPSNWELSTARAISALRYIINSGEVDVSRLGAAGFADTHNIATNDTPEGRAKNRRVAFIFYAP